MLKQHNKLDRFGICLLHKHFDVNDDEVMKEEYDAQTRTTTTQPVHINTLPKGSTIDTMWDLREDQPLVKCSYGKCD